MKDLSAKQQAYDVLIAGRFVIIGVRNNMNKQILDVCCGSKMFWFEKDNPNATERRVARLTKGENKNEHKGRYSNNSQH